MDEGNRVSDRGGEREQHLGGEESKENTGEEIIKKSRRGEVRA